MMCGRQLRVMSDEEYSRAVGRRLIVFISTHKVSVARHDRMMTNDPDASNNIGDKERKYTSSSKNRCVIMCKAAGADIVTMASSAEPFK